MRGTPLQVHILDSASCPVEPDWLFLPLTPYFHESGVRTPRLSLNHRSLKISRFPSPSCWEPTTTSHWFLLRGQSTRQPLSLGSLHHLRRRYVCQISRPLRKILHSYHHFTPLIVLPDRTLCRPFTLFLTDPKSDHLTPKEAVWPVRLRCTMTGTIYKSTSHMWLYGAVTSLFAVVLFQLDFDGRYASGKSLPPILGSQACHSKSWPIKCRLQVNRLHPLESSTFPSILLIMSHL